MKETVKRWAIAAAMAVGFVVLLAATIIAEDVYRDIFIK